MKKYYRVVRLIVEGRERFDAQYRPWFAPLWEPVKIGYFDSIEAAEQGARDHAQRETVRRMGPL